MKISGHPHRAQLDPARHDSKADRGAERDPAPAGPVEPAARVKVSDAARRAQDPGAPDLQKVERLRAALEAGELKVDPQQIADRMIEEEV